MDVLTMDTEVGRHVDVSRHDTFFVKIFRPGSKNIKYSLIEIYLRSIYNKVENVIYQETNENFKHSID